MDNNFDLQIYCSWSKHWDLRNTNVEKAANLVASFKINYNLSLSRNIGPSQVINKHKK